MIQYRYSKGKESKQMKKTMYRIKYRNGKVGAWNTDYNKTKEMADFFNAKVETKEFKKI